MQSQLCLTGLVGVTCISLNIWATVCLFYEHFFSWCWLMCVFGPCRLLQIYLCSINLLNHLFTVFNVVIHNFLCNTGYSECSVFFYHLTIIETKSETILYTVFFLFLCFRQVQHLRHAEGSECQKHNYYRPGGPAMLGAGFHVVSY